MKIEEKSIFNLEGIKALGNCGEAQGISGEIPLDFWMLLWGHFTEGSLEEENLEEIWDACFKEKDNLFLSKEGEKNKKEDIFSIDLEDLDILGIIGGENLLLKKENKDQVSSNLLDFNKSADKNNSLLKEFKIFKNTKSSTIIDDPLEEKTNNLGNKEKITFTTTENLDNEIVKNDLKTNKKDNSFLVNKEFDKSNSDFLFSFKEEKKENKNILNKRNKNINFIPKNFKEKIKVNNKISEKRKQIKNSNNYQKEKFSPKTKEKILNINNKKITIKIDKKIESKIVTKDNNYIKETKNNNNNIIELKTDHREIKKKQNFIDFNKEQKIDEKTINYDENKREVTTKNNNETDKETTYIINTKNTKKEEKTETKIHAKNQINKNENNITTKQIDHKENIYSLNSNNLRENIENAKINQYININNLSDFVKDLAIKSTKIGKNEAKIHLEPPELGHLHISLEINKGEVKLLFTVEHAHTAQTLQQNLDQLAKSLQDLGLNLGGCEINYGQQQENKQNFIFKNNNNKAKIASISSEEEKTNNYWKKSNTLIDIRI